MEVSSLPLFLTALTIKIATTIATTRKRATAAIMAICFLSMSLRSAALASAFA